MRKRMKKYGIMPALSVVMVWICMAMDLSVAKGDESLPAHEKNGGTVTIVDCAKRRVQIPAKVRRIGCLYAFSGHAAVMLGRCNDIVAVSNGLKRDSLLLDICPAITGALVPKAQGAVNLEELLRAQTDLVFVSGETGRNRGTVEKLDRMKIPWLVVDYDSMKGQQAAVELIGKALGNPEKAARYNRYYRECVERVQKVTSKIPEAQKFRLYHSVNEANRTTIEKGLATDWLEVEGVINVSLKPDMNLLEGRNFVSLEQILLWDPDVILVNEPTVRKHIMHDMQWSTIKAVKAKRVYQMPIAISRWGHPGSIETPLAILWTAKRLYPERFPNLDMPLETKAFYRDFFDFELPDDLVDKILSGKLVRKPKKDSSLF